MTIMENKTAGAVDVQTSGARTVDEPRLTIAELQQLLREAAAYERAQRPIVLHGPAQPATAPQTAVQAHPGIAVTYPAPAAESAPAALSRRLYTRPELVYACGVTSAVSTMVAGIASAVAHSPVPLFAAGVGGLLTSVGAAVVMTNDDDRAQLKAWNEHRRARKAEGR